LKPESAISKLTETFFYYLLADGVVGATVPAGAVGCCWGGAGGFLAQPLTDANNMNIPKDKPNNFFIFFTSFTF